MHARYVEGHLTWCLQNVVGAYGKWANTKQWSVAHEEATLKRNEYSVSLTN